MLQSIVNLTLSFAAAKDAACGEHNENPLHLQHSVTYTLERLCQFQFLLFCMQQVTREELLKTTDQPRNYIYLKQPYSVKLYFVLISLVLTSMYWIYGSVLRLKFNSLVSRQNCKLVQHNKVKITCYTCIQFRRLINLDPGIQVFAFLLQVKVTCNVQNLLGESEQVPQTQLAQSLPSRHFNCHNMVQSQQSAILMIGIYFYYVSGPINHMDI